MQKWLKTLLSSACAATLIAAAGAQADDIGEHTFRFAFQNVKEHPQGQGAQKFAELLSEKSGGKMTVKLFPGGVLGGDLQTVSALQGGTLDMTVLNSGILSAQVKDFAMLDFPFLFDSNEQAFAVIDGKVGQELAKRLEDKGLHTLGYWDLGFRNMTNSKHPITKVEDVEGLKLRVIQSPIYIETFKALGANPVPMPFPEVYTALEQKVVDGQENPFTTIAGNKFNEVQKYLSVTRHIYNPQSFLISAKSWSKLNPDEQKLVSEVAKEAEAYERDVSVKAQDVARENLAKSMEINDITPAEMARFRDKVKPVIEQFSKDLDQDLVKTMYDDIEKTRK
ncbi:TRAP transporter substrate-binding protein [Pokkaliibacter sp. MBI-7]|uniref:ABC transporter substrate-binding protein n=1 Tax=Proteobacteria bacterium 228 TaxID=2083153 RepID=A0A2S5KLL7_9PROT|nr:MULTISPECIES: TRAP transporter substrate-binding protein [Pokkaliibacter]MDH2431491.1 TRAP transporter substrate-binding protein [Pokkaliibacter sp. MBI-7]PPC75724.1 ABC transporter substrate-binding protein [Pokkaliibacter plantistimulans]